MSNVKCVNVSAGKRNIILRKLADLLLIKIQFMCKKWNIILRKLDDFCLK